MKEGNKDMKNNLRTYILGILTLFSIYIYYLSENNLKALTNIIIKDVPTIETQKEEQAALNYLNELRKGAGLVAFTSQEQLKTAARNHGDYLIENDTIGHFQDENKTLFTGMYASSRIVHAGYRTPLVIENVSSNNQNYKESIDGLFSAIYHRMAFLDFQSDEIGIGIRQNMNDKTKTAFVYDMSAKALNKLYKEKNFKNPKEGYIPNKVLAKALSSHKDDNAKVVTYPFKDQKDIPAAFFDELPDPLPLHSVSGFPVSVSFNQAHFKEVKLLKFELFNSDGQLVNDTLIYDHKTDPNQRLNDFDFVLFPLTRLDWSSKYQVNFIAMVDGKKVVKNWSFTTRTFEEPLHRVTSTQNRFTIHKNESNIFYFPPSSKIDVLQSLMYPANIDIDFIDKNTIKLTALKDLGKPIILNIGRHTLKLDIQTDS
jgi:uncharacterized protein YkwD